MNIIYECEYCDYQDRDEEYMEEHEKDCSLNPANKERYSHMKKLISSNTQISYQKLYGKTPNLELKDL